MITTVINPISRYFVTLDPVLNSYYEMAAPITFAGDFEIEVEFSTTSTQTQILVGGTTDNNFIALVSSQTIVRFKFNGFQADSTDLNLNDGKLHKVKVIRVGALITTFVDGIQSVSMTASGSASFGYIGAWYQFSFCHDGIIANAKFTDKSGASDVVTTFRLGNSPADVNYTYSTELLDNNTFTNGTTDWYSPRGASSLSIINNKLVSIADSTAVFGAGQQVDNLIVGNVYKMKARSTCNNAAATMFLTASASTVLTPSVIFTQGTSTALIDSLFTATATTMYFGVVVNGHAANDTVTIDAGITVKEVTNYTEANEASEIEYSQENVFGAEEVVNGDFSNGTTDWTVTNGGAQSLISVVNNQLVFTGDGSASYALAGSEYMSLTVGKTYLITADIIAVTGNNRMLVVAGNAQKSITSAGKFEWLYTSTDDTSRGVGPSFNNDANASITIDNVSVKEITNAVEYKNIPQTARELYSLEDDIWTGSNELVVNGDFATDSDWVLEGGDSTTWVIESGLATRISSIDWGLRQDLTGMVTGNTYLVEFDIVTLTSGTLAVTLGLGATASIYGVEGHYAEELEWTGSGGRLKFSGSFIGSIDNVSVKEVIEVADFYIPPTRWLSTLDPILNSNYEIAKPIIFTGDFEIEVDLQHIVTDPFKTIISGDNQNTTTLNIDINGNSLRAFAYNQGVLSGPIQKDISAFADKLITVKLVYTGVNAGLYINNILEGSGTWGDLSGVYVSYIGKRITDSYFDGIIANAKFTDKSGSEPVTTTFALDNSTATNNYILNAEEVVNGDFATTNTSYWTTLNSSVTIAGNGVAAINYSGGYTGLLVNQTAFQEGSFYSVSIVVDSVSSGGFDLYLYSFVETISSSGVYTYTVNGNSSGKLQLAGSNFTGILSSITVKEITNYEQAQQLQDIEYSAENVFGSELVINGDFATDLSGWTNTSNWWQWVGGKAYHPNTNSILKLTQNLTTSASTSYIISFTASGVVGLAQAFAESSVGAASDVLVFSSDGSYQLITANPSTINFSRSAGQYAEFYIDNISVKEITNAVKYKNIPESNHKEYSKPVIDGEWVEL